MTQLYLVLLIAGVMLIGAEVFVPDGILGTIGGLFLLGAATVGFMVFPPALAALALLGKVILVCLTIAAWVKFFPKTPIGKRMMVSENLKAAHSTDESLPALKGAKGITTSDLRPSGYAEIDGRRIDVLSASGDSIPTDSPIEVVKVEGYRVLVEPIPPTSES